MWECQNAPTLQVWALVFWITSSVDNHMHPELSNKVQHVEPGCLS